MAILLFIQKKVIYNDIPPELESDKLFVSYYDYSTKMLEDCCLNFSYVISVLKRCIKYYDFHDDADLFDEVLAQYNLLMNLLRNKIIMK